MKALSYLMGQRRVYVPKALTREILEAVCRIVRVDDLDAMTAASVLVVDLVWGARAADLYLTDWSELQLERKRRTAREEAARVIGLTWRRLQTKNDRQGRKDAPKALQCSTGCDGTLKVTEDGRLDGIPCPVHMLLATKKLQAEAVCVPVDELVGPPWGHRGAAGEAAQDAENTCRSMFIPKDCSPKTKDVDLSIDYAFPNEFT